MQRPAKPSTPVRFRPPPPIFARVVKLVDTRDLKSLGLKQAMPVRLRPRAPFRFRESPEIVIPAYAGIQIALGPGVRRGDELRLIGDSLAPYSGRLDRPANGGKLGLIELVFVTGCQCLLGTLKASSA